MIDTPRLQKATGRIKGLAATLWFGEGQSNQSAPGEADTQSLRMEDHMMPRVISITPIKCRRYSELCAPMQAKAKNGIQASFPTTPQAPRNIMLMPEAVFYPWDGRSMEMSQGHSAETGRGPLDIAAALLLANLIGFT